jgi:hypothetical protein
MRLSAISSSSFRDFFASTNLPFENGDRLDCLMLAKICCKRVEEDAGPSSSLFVCRSQLSL